MSAYVPCDLGSKPMICGEFKSSVVPAGLAASEVILDISGKFMQSNGAGYLVKADATSVDVVGWLLSEAVTASATAGETVRGLETNAEKLYVMPVNYGAGTVPTEAQLQAAVFESCDIYVASNKQWANIAASSIDILMVYGYYIAADGTTFAIVKLNVEKVAQTGVA